MFTKPEIILGTVQLGMKYGVQNRDRASGPSVAERLSILERAHQLGISKIDTSNDYGEAQDIIGRFPHKNSFKIFSQFRLTAERPTVMEQFQYTREVLDVNPLECYSFSHFEDIKEFPKALTELVQLQKDGMIKNIGVSITSNDQLQQVIKIPEIKMIQMPFNVLDNFSRRGILLVKAREAGKILYARSAYLQGLLLMSMEKIPAPLKSVIPLMRQLQQIANRRRITVECLCLGYVLQQKLFDGLIIGVDNKDQLIKNWQSYQSASRVEIDLAEINRLIVDDPRILDPNQWQTL